MVHPLDEPLGLRLQCTRAFFHKKYDADRQRYGNDAARDMYCEARDAAIEAEQLARDNGEPRAQKPFGAQQCDLLCFKSSRRITVGSTPDSSVN
jgi:hypothetical protein